MLRLNCLVATCVLTLTAGAANATTFDVTGTASLPMGGTLDISGGTVGPEDVTVPNPPNTLAPTAFTFLTSSAAGVSGFWDITLNQGATGFSLLLILPVSSLAGYAGGAINTALFYPTSSGPEAFTAICQGGACGSLTASTSTSPTTPLPAALPLFATGLGALGLLGWRRKRKAPALAA